jgi:hypothetical protein
MADDVSPTTTPLDGSMPEVPEVSERLGGAFIAGYGCYVALDEIAKIETVSAGISYFVMAHLRGQAPTGEATQRSTAFLTPPLDSEEEAHRLCDAIAKKWLRVLSTNPDTGGAHWPTPEPPVAERFGL